MIHIHMHIIQRINDTIKFFFSLSFAHNYTTKEMKLNININNNNKSNTNQISFCMHEHFK